MKCLLFAYSEIGTVALETLLAMNEDVVGVVTHEDHPTEVRWWRSVSELACARGIPVIMPHDPNAPDSVAWGQALHPDIIFSFYYRQMLRTPWLTLAPLGAFNLHGSLLPKFRGRAPVNWAIIQGATETGLTLHEMVERPDAGKIVDQAAIPILEQDTARDVFEKLLPLVPMILQRTIPLLANARAARRPQDESTAKYFGARTPADGELDWRWPTRQVHNLVRGLTRPYPGAFTFLDGRKFFVWKGRILSEGQRQEAPGEIHAAVENGVPVSCADGLYLIEAAQEDGAIEKAPHQQFLKGQHFAVREATHRVRP